MASAMAYAIWGMSRWRRRLSKASVYASREKTWFIAFLMKRDRRDLSCRNQCSMSGRRARG